MSRSRVLTLLLGCFIFGVVVMSWWRVPPIFLGTLLVGSGLIIAMGAARRESMTIVIGIALLGCVLGILRAQSAGLPVAVYPLVHTLPNYFVGTVRTYTSRSGGTHVLVIDSPDSAGAIVIQSRFLRTVFLPGTKVQVSCVSIAGLDPHDSFDGHYLAQGVIARCVRPNIRIIAAAPSDNLIAHLRDARTRASDIFHRYLTAPNDAFATSLVLGAQRELPDRLRDEFRVTGTSHIVAISGANISLLVRILLRWFTLLVGMSAGTPFVGLAIILFVLMTGASAGAVRAGTMGFLALVLYRIGRRTHALPVITLVAAVMLGIAPDLARYDLSFQLSFLAIIGVLILSPRIAQHLERLPDPILIRSYLADTLAVLFIIMPFLSIKLGTITPIALVVNLFILPLVPLAMGGGLVLLAVGGVPALATWVASAENVLLSAIRWLVHVWAQSPGSAAVTWQIPWWCALIWYTFLVYWMTRQNAKGLPKSAEVVSV